MSGVTFGMVLEARERLRGIVRRTELVPSRTLSGDGREVFLKTESLQHTGSFKLRGAYNRISRLTEDERRAGVVASSAGNHAQGVALAAKMFGVKATIVMPEGASLAKIAATRELGAEVILDGASFDDAFQRALKVREETGATLVHAFQDPLVVAGQGTVGLEILEDLKDVDSVIVPIGGGGLIGGIALAIKELRPQARVIGVEAEAADAMVQSLKKGGPVMIESASTIADGIAIKYPGELTYGLCRQYVDEVVTVDEDEIAGAVLVLLERCKVVAEGAGAASVAALLSGKGGAHGKVACVVSGGNIDVTTLQRIINRGLTKEGRLTHIDTVVVDRPGHLQRLLAVVAGAGANVMSVRHDRVDESAGAGMVKIGLTLETNNRAHYEKVLLAVKEAGHRIIGHR
ncbi:MAG: L-threonine dehydratase catabolic TdcB [Firmicutes bacterium ADurb.Bin467]|nr:MAG: L-threonine dehydratase catabolic TdcB [Firmicutes bacterium ADurb.Bin467]